MVEPNEKELLEFMEKNYGKEWATKENLTLAKLLYAKKNGKKSISNPLSNKENTKIEKFSDISGDGNYEIDCVVFNTEFVRYMGCPICRKSIKRNCQHILQGTNPVELMSINIEVLDKCSEQLQLRTCIKSEDFEEFGEGDLIKIFITVAGDRKYLNEYKVLKRVNLDNGASSGNVMVDNPKNNEMKNVNSNSGNVNNTNNKSNNMNNLKELLAMLSKLNGLNKIAFERMAADWGLDLDFVKNYVVLNDNGRYILNETGQKFLEQS